jgi:hypothetical protein
MSTQIQYRRGTTAQNDNFTGALGEMTIDTTLKTVRVHDGATTGGFATVGVTTTQTLTNKTLSNVALSGNATGTANIVITGIASATGNITGGNIITSALLSSATLSVSGNANVGNLGTVGLIVATGNITGGNLTTGAQISATGNITGGNLTTGAQISATGNITGGNLIGTYANGTTNINIPASNGNLNVSVGGQANVLVITTSGANITGTLNATGNANVGNIGATNANVTALTASGNINAGNLSLGTGILVAGPTSITGNLTVTGNITAVGNLNYDQVTDLVVGDPLVFFGANNTANIYDLGFVVEWNDGVQQHGGLARDASDGTWKLFANVVSQPTTTINFSDAIYSPIRTGAATFAGANINGALTGATTISATGNITGGNLTTGAEVVATGNITGANIIATVDVYTPEIVKTGSNAVGNIGQSTNYFNTAFVKATSAQYADLAEKYEADIEYDSGTVVIFGGSKEITISKTSHDPAIAGVISTNPSYIMNAGLDANAVALVALTGRVPTKVTGPIAKGDRLVSSNIPGVACRLEQVNYQPGCIIGKALENYNQDGIGTIEVVVGRL